MDIEGLIERVEKATGPDRELDADLVRALCKGATVGTYVLGDDGDVVFHAQELGIANKHLCPAYTASVDAALAIVERVAPGGLLDLTLGYEPGAKDRAWPAVTIRFYPDGVLVDGKQWHCEIETRPTPALAIILALLRSLQAKDREGTR